MKFINFDLSLEPRAGEGYPVLADSPRYGQARAVCRLDCEGPDITAKLAAIAGDRLDGEGLASFGRLLAANVLNGQVEDLFSRMVGGVQAQPKMGVRIRIRIGAPELNVLPWELLRTENGHDPLGVSTRTALTRYIEMNEPVREVAAPRPLRMLGIIPQGSGLDTDREKAALEKAVAELGSSVQLEWLEGAVTRERIRDVLGEAEYHLVHFIGHGSMEGGRAALRLNDEYGDDCPVPAETFSGFFRESSVRLVVLNACRGAARAADDAMKGVAPQVVGRGVTAVVAMQWDVEDRVAQQFARSFYRSLCVGPEAGEVDTAVTRGRAVLYDDWPGSKAFATPVLFLRAEDGRLWAGREAEAAGDKEAEIPEAKPIQTVNADYIGVMMGNNNVIGGQVTGGDYITGSRGIEATGDAGTGGADFARALRALTTQMQSWHTAIRARVDGLTALSPDEKQDLKDQANKIRLELVKNRNLDPAYLAKLVNVLGVMGGNELVELTVARLSEPLSGVGISMKMNTDYKVSAGRDV